MLKSIRISKIYHSPLAFHLYLYFNPFKCERTFSKGDFVRMATILLPYPVKEILSNKHEHEQAHYIDY